MSKSILTVLLVFVLGLGGFILLSDLAVYSGRQQIPVLSKPPAHGTSATIQADLSQAGGSTNTMAALKQAISRRFDKFGARVFWESLPDARARIVAPISGERQLGAFTNLILQGGHLELRLVHPMSDQIVVNGQVPPGYELLKHTQTRPTGSGSIEILVVKKDPEIGSGGNIIKSARAVRDSLGRPEIDFDLNPESAAAFAELTRTNIDRRLAFVVDGELYSAPIIRSPIETGYGQITGSFSMNEALLLADLMEHPLPVQVRLLESKTF